MQWWARLPFQLKLAFASARASVAVKVVMDWSQVLVAQANINTRAHARSLDRTRTDQCPALLARGNRPATDDCVTPYRSSFHVGFIHHRRICETSWWLIVKALQGGAEALRSAHRAWWLAALIGLSMVLAAAVSMLLPDSPKSSSAASFREDLERCIVGVPLVVIFAHLWAEARFRLSA
jgi:hypothetical protein